jgi:hypothetical protein
MPKTACRRKDERHSRQAEPRIHLAFTNIRLYFAEDGIQVMGTRKFHPLQGAPLLFGMDRSGRNWRAELNLFDSSYSTESPPIWMQFSNLTRHSAKTAPSLPLGDAREHPHHTIKKRLFVSELSPIKAFLSFPNR